jgi:CBS domain-containing protein
MSQSAVVYTKDVHSVQASATVRDAVCGMVEQKVSSALVLDGAKPVGIFTERDAIHRVLAKGLDANTTRVDAVMSKDLETISPDTRIAEAIEIMKAGKFRHLPVMSGDAVVGIVSVGDLTQVVTRENEHLVGYITGTYPG